MCAYPRGVYYTTQVQGARASQGTGRRPRALERGFLDQAVHNGPEPFTARLRSLLFQFRSTQKCEMERVREGVTHLAPCRAQCELRCIVSDTARFLLPRDAAAHRSQRSTCSWAARPVGFPMPRATDGGDKHDSAHHRAARVESTLRSCNRPHCDGFLPCYQNR